MKKSTKIITTAIALVLVMSFMVVGILAATSATAGISASVSWIAEAGLEIEIHAWTEKSKEDYDSMSSQEKDFGSENKDVGQFVKNHRMTPVVIDTTTTNNEASGISRSFNATFYDGSNDGVNNPECIYYIYRLINKGVMRYEGDEISGSSISVNVSLTKYPQSTSNVNVQFAYFSTGLLYGSYYNILESGYLDNMSSIVPEIGELPFREGDSSDMELFCIKLTLLTPNESLSNFDAGVGFKFEKVK